MIVALPIVLALVAADPAPAPAAAAPTREQRLGAGEILVWRDTKDKEAVIVNAVIDVAPEVLWPVIWDCGSYKKTMKGIGDSVIVKDDGDSRVCTVTADLPFPLPDLVSTSRAVRHVEPGKLYTRTWTFIEGDYTRNDGQWKLEPFGTDGKRTLATYRLAAVPNIPVPESMALSLQQKKLPDMIKHLREVAATLPKPAP